MTFRQDAVALARAAVRAVDPRAGVRRELRRTAHGFLLGRRSLPLGPNGRLAIVALGKAAAAMADGALTIAGDRVSGIVIAPRGYPQPTSPLRVVAGEHPVPGRRSFLAGTELLRFVRGLGTDDVALFLLSGGGSAAAEVPVPPLTEGDLARSCELLLASGAPIGEMNTVRRHLSALKGGQLALACGARRFGTLALSDVVGDRPEDIASGPTVGDPSTFREALRTVRRYPLLSSLPQRVLTHLRLGVVGRRQETPPPDLPRLRNAPFVLVGSNRMALAAAAREARARGYRPRVLTRPVVGETRPAGATFARRLLSELWRSGRMPLALLAGGETTVTLGPRPGRGGRNLEFVLAATAQIAGRNALVLSIGTDGRDGPTDVAGGWVDGRSLDRARRAAIDLDEALRRHDAYPAVAALGGLVRTGPTGTNVMDLHVGLRGPPRVASRQRSLRYGRK